MVMATVRDRALHQVVYPESDGEPMAESWLQAEVIRMLVHGFQRLLAGRPGVVVGGDNFWYPVEGDPKTVTAPDVIVIVDMPRIPPLQDMGSYRQWEHGGHPALVVEVLSLSNTYREMVRKREFYERFGVDEYWVFDPEDGGLEVWLRHEGQLHLVPPATEGHISPTTGVTVAVDNGELSVKDPGGRRRWLYLADEAVLSNERAAESAAAVERAETEARRAETEARRAETEARRAEAEARRAEAEAQRADRAEQRARQLEARLAELEGRGG